MVPRLVSKNGAEFSVANSHLIADTIFAVYEPWVSPIMPLLYYWRGDNYRRDLDAGAGYHLNQASYLLQTVGFGDSLWAFTRRTTGEYTLAAELIVHAKTLNPPRYQYGRYRVWGELKRSRYFQIDTQSDITSLIRSLSIRSGAGVLGRAFQGLAAVRQLSAEDHGILSHYSRDLPPEVRACLLPEERLEALLVSQDERAVEALLHEEPSGLAETRKRYLFLQAIKRDPMLVQQMRERYQGRCQICKWEPRSIYGSDICETHHIQWLSRGGFDTDSNLVLLCPNHHRAVHSCDAQFDWDKFAFVFSPQRCEELSLREHHLELRER